MHFSLAWLLIILLANPLLDTILDVLNLGHLQTEVPPKFKDVFDPAKYKESQEYLRANTRFGLVRRIVTTLSLLIFLGTGGFNVIDLWARSLGHGEIVTGLVFVAALSALKFVLSLPFSIYHTFVLEEKFGFNKTTPKTFTLDIVKGTLLGVLLGAPLFSLLILFFEKLGRGGWSYAWLSFTAISLGLSFVAPVLILPLFNKFKPLSPSPLKNAIEEYAREQKFVLSGISVMDSSMRSTKSNAFFAGFGRFRRLVLFDTLIERQSVDELVAVVAHEVGHFKCKHIPRFIAISIASSFVMFYGLSLFLNNPTLFSAFQMEQTSVYASILFMGLVYSPISRLLSLFPNSLSRKFEFQADAFSIKTYGKREALISALKKLSRDNLSNLTPHPWKVAMDYTHPPVIERIHVLENSPLNAFALAKKPT